MTVSHLRELLDSKRLSCTELTDGLLKKIKKENGEINAFSLVTEEVALSAAAEADRRIAVGNCLGALDGIPMSLKDNICTMGIETTCCSEILRGWKPPYSATVWNILQNNGAVMLGKANMDEFAMGSTCETSCFGGSRNPYDTERVAGGSSGGSAASVSALQAAYSLGSDTGGSIRIPAAYCGVVGLKPTYGTVSRFGLIGLAPSFDQIGSLTVDATDCALVFDALNKYDRMDETSHRGERKAVSGTLDGDVKGLKIGIAPELFEGAAEDVGKAVEKTVAMLERAGARTVKISLPYIRYATQVYCIICCAQASTNLGRFDSVRLGNRADGENAGEIMTRSRAAGFGDEVKRRVMMGAMVLSAGGRTEYYEKAQRVRQAIAASINSALEECDVIISPTGAAVSKRANNSEDFIKEYKTDEYLVGANLAGVPAISVPCGFDRDGMPIGLQLIGRKFDERTIINCAHAVELLTNRAYIRSEGSIEI